MTEEFKKKVKELREKSGCGMYECRRALEYCDEDIDVAYEFLKMYGQAVARYKIVNGKKVHWGINDYVEAAKKLKN